MSRASFNEYITSILKMHTKGWYMHRLELIKLESVVFDQINHSHNAL